MHTGMECSRLRFGAIFSRLPVHTSTVSTCRCFAFSWHSIVHASTCRQHLGFGTCCAAVDSFSTAAVVRWRSLLARVIGRCGPDRPRGRLLAKRNQHRAHFGSS